MVGRRAAPSASGPATPAPTGAGLATPAEPAALTPGRPAKRHRGAHSSTVAATHSQQLVAEPAAEPEPAVPLCAAVPEAAPAALEDVVPATPAPGAAAAGSGPVGEDEEPWRMTRTRRRVQRSDAAEAAVWLPAGGKEAAAEDVQEPAGKGTAKKGGSRRRVPIPPPINELPTPELLARLRASGYAPPPLPVPNLGYACLNMELRECKPPIFTSRDCIQRTMLAKGPPYLGELFLANAKDLALMIQWNHEHGIRLFRMSSVICPWMGTVDFRELPHFEEIKAALRFAGDLAHTYGQRLTFHPSHFVKLAAPDEELAAKSMRELEAHSQVMDLMGLEATAFHKMNIHTGGIYASQGSKEDTMRRWAANYAKLSPRCRARMTVENDDQPGAFSVSDLLFLHSLCGVPIVFDFHHHKFCPGELSERQALLAAVQTWPAGVRPVVHWSESQAGRRPHAHSDYVRGPIFLHGLEGQVDVMIEAKCKERALLAYRGDIPMPDGPVSATQAGGGEAGEATEAAAA